MLILYPLDIPVGRGIYIVTTTRIIERLPQVCGKGTGGTIALVRPPELHDPEPKDRTQVPKQKALVRGIPKVAQDVRGC